MMSYLVAFVILVVGVTVDSRLAGVGDDNGNFLYPGLSRGTLDDVKVIRHVSSGRCLIVEKGKRGGSPRENQVILWRCNDKLIKGLEQQMFSLTKAYGGTGYLLLGNAGSGDRCVTADRGYNDLLLTRRCYPPQEETATWQFRRIGSSSTQTYQIVQVASARCMRSPGDQDGSWVRVGDCDVEDERQLWHICGLDGRCDFQQK